MVSDISSTMAALVHEHQNVFLTRGLIGYATLISHFSKAPHVSQCCRWDCGVACAQMVLQGLGRDTERSSLLASLGTRSVWTIDLAMLLHRYGVRFMYCTRTLGVTEAFSTVDFYRSDFDSDARRVQALFKAAEEAKVGAIQKAFSWRELAVLLSGYEYVAIVLVDSRYLCPAYGMSAPAPPLAPPVAGVGASGSIYGSPVRSPVSTEVSVERDAVMVTFPQKRRGKSPTGREQVERRKWRRRRRERCDASSAEKSPPDHECGLGDGVESDVSRPVGTSPSAVFGHSSLAFRNSSSYRAQGVGDAVNDHELDPSLEAMPLSPPRSHRRQVGCDNMVVGKGPRCASPTGVLPSSPTVGGRRKRMNKAADGQLLTAGVAESARGGTTPPPCSQRSSLRVSHRNAQHADLEPSSPRPPKKKATLSPPKSPPAVTVAPLVTPGSSDSRDVTLGASTFSCSSSSSPSPSSTPSPSPPSPSPSSTPSPSSPPSPLPSPSPAHSPFHPPSSSTPPSLSQPSPSSPASSYCGHYILLVGWSEAEGVFIARDPSLPSLPQDRSRNGVDANGHVGICLTPEALDRARRSYGTDEDVLVIDLARSRKGGVAAGPLAAAAAATAIAASATSSAAAASALLGLLAMAAAAAARAEASGFSAWSWRERMAWFAGGGGSSSASTGGDDTTARDENGDTQPEDHEDGDGKGWPEGMAESAAKRFASLLSLAASGWKFPTVGEGGAESAAKRLAGLLSLAASGLRFPTVVGDGCRNTREGREGTAESAAKRLASLLSVAASGLRFPSVGDGYRYPWEGKGGGDANVVGDGERERWAQRVISALEGLLEGGRRAAYTMEGLLEGGKRAACSLRDSLADMADAPGGAGAECGGGLAWGVSGESCACCCDPPSNLTPCSPGVIVSSA